MINSSYKAVLVDVDGTLVDSNDAHAHAWWRRSPNAESPWSVRAYGVQSGWAVSRD